MKKILIRAFLALFFLVAICLADTKTTNLAETTDVQDTDILYIVDGATSKKITVLNLFDMIDTSLELLTILTDETGTGVAVFGTAPTFTTSITIGGAAMSEVDLEKLDDITNGTAAANKAVVLDGSLDIATINSLTATTLVGALTGNASTATLATTVTVTDNEDTAENNPMVFVAGADPDGGSLGLETDGTCYYTPSTGTITTTEFVGGGVGITGVTAAHTGTITWGGVSVLESGVAFQFGDATDATLTHTYANTGDNVVIAYSTGAMGVTGTLTATNLSGTNTGDNTDAATGDSATNFFDAGTIEHEWGGLQANVSAYTGLIGITGPDTTVEVDSKSELETHIADVADFAEADGDVFTGDHDFGGADLELPQGQTPDTDGDVDLDFTDGTLVVQHGAAHAKLAGATDVVMGKLIKSFTATIFAPDGVNDVIPVKPIVADEFPHGIEVVAVHMVVGTDSDYTIDVENWDDFDTINGANPSINSTAYTNGNNGEVTDSTMTEGTVAAGQIIMIDIPATDIDWVSITIYYYEPIA